MYLKVLDVVIILNMPKNETKQYMSEKIIPRTPNIN